MPDINCYMDLFVAKLQKPTPVEDACAASCCQTA